MLSLSAVIERIHPFKPEYKHSVATLKGTSVQSSAAQTVQP